MAYIIELVQAATVAITKMIMLMIMMIEALSTLRKKNNNNNATPLVGRI